MGTGCVAARALIRDTSLSGLNVLISRSMRRISSSTASIAATPWVASGAHSSTVMRVPMMPSSTRSTHSACAGGREDITNNRQASRGAGNGFSFMGSMVADQAELIMVRSPGSRAG